MDVSVNIGMGMIEVLFPSVLADNEVEASMVSEVEDSVFVSEVDDSVFVRSMIEPIVVLLSLSVTKLEFDGTLLYVAEIVEVINPDDV